MSRTRTLPALPLLACLLVVGCATANGVVKPADMTLSVQNGTSQSVVLFVGDARVRDIAPGALVEIPAAALPPLPWVADVRLPTGRTLVSLTVRAGEVIEETNSQKGDAARVDLSCGRIDLWSGPPLSGPAPGPGTPGDCNP